MDILDLKEQRKEEEKIANIPVLNQAPYSFTKGVSYFWDTFKILIIALAIIVPVRMYVVQPFIVEGDSMVPNFHNGEYLIVDEISYRFSGPQRGQVVIFHPPNNPKEYYIKRIIGLPGETVELKDGNIYIYNSESSQVFRLKEDAYLMNSDITEDLTVELKDDQYYVLGDNRYNSKDSRVFGPITLEEIRGKAALRAYPFNSFSLMENPQYSS